ncbi:hypothetical protein [Tenacibaculum singaporense]|uniref:Uncharacterized protein n=1 Tax=Tenacibaculum singaporense TaxID=2358479 RepID=A0A3S8R5D0_9FLAO|nr:hypothetical protein [Tenacibaculum singaporense]AZJ34977.1 hypothetical protein D6T69_05330 [Tenacibaculum singaporense]
MEQKPNKKQQARFFLKANPGIYGKGHKQITSDNLVQIDDKHNISSIPISSPIGIYVRQKTKFVNKNILINFLLILSIVFIILLKFVFVESFNSVFEKNIESVISKLCFAYIASFIFYFIVIKRSEKNKKKEAYAIICALNDSLITHGNNVKKWIHEGAKEEIDTSLDKDIFKKICSKVDLNITPKGLNIKIGDLIFLDGVKKVNYYIEKIFIYMPFLEGDLLIHLNKIQNCIFSRTITIIPYKSQNNLKEYSNDILEFLQLIEELKTLNNSLKVKFLKNYEKTY